jgi:ribose transport system substrate-binding protein
MLKDRNLIDNPYWVLSENGSPAGVPLLKDGSLKYTVSMSPTYEGVLGFLALHKHVLKASDKVNQQVLIPIFGITGKNINDIVPWEPEDPEVFFKLTEKNYPELMDF